MQKRTFFAVVVPVFLALTGCESMTKKIDVDEDEYPYRLAVSAVLERDAATGTGHFTLSLFEAVPVTSYVLSWQDMPRTKSGTVLLYREGSDEPLVNLSGKFDLRSRKDAKDETVYGNIDMNIPSVAAGVTYRLEISLEGYDPVSSTAVMPADPVLDHVSIDMEHTRSFESVGEIDNITGHSGNTGYVYYPVKCTLTDDAGRKDYYALKAGHAEWTENTDYASAYHDPEDRVGVTSAVLIQDNPDREAEAEFMEGGETWDLYEFGTLLISDMTFAGGSAALELYTPLQRYDYGAPYIYYERPEYYTPETFGPEVIIKNRRSLSVSHISTETFRHYRSLVLQENGMGFFAEPVLMVSNVKDGYGCFALQSTVSVALGDEYETYWYPQNDPYPQPDYPFYE